MESSEAYIKTGDGKSAIKRRAVVLRDRDLFAMEITGEGISGTINLARINDEQCILSDRSPKIKIIHYVFMVNLLKEDISL